MKKITSFLMALALMTTLAQTALAASAYPSTMANPYQDTVYPLIISPRYSYTQSITAALSFSGGQAHCSGSVLPSGSYNCSITVTLYKQNGSDWDYVTSWSGSATGRDKAAAGGSTSVGSGTYKVVASANVGGKEFPSKSVTRTKN